MSRFVIGALTFGVAILINSAPAASAPRPPLIVGTVSSIKEYLTAAPVELRPTLTTSPVIFVDTPQGLASFRHEPSPLFPVSARLPVSITKVQGSPSTAFTISFMDSHRRRGQIHLWPLPGRSLDDSTVYRLLSAAFVLDTASAVTKPYVLNTVSRMIHAAGCNHLPPANSSIAFGSRAEAMDAGGHVCPICFTAQPQVFDYDTERRLGAQMAGALRASHPPSGDAGLQQRLSSMGQRVLQSWPRPLKGYSYTFEVLVSRDPQAYSCPAGAVFVTTGLMDAIESEGELEAVLAHEIAHVELRHGYARYRRALLAKGISLGVALATGLILSSQGQSVDVVDDAMDIARLMSSVIASIVLQGYSRTEETESDLYSVLYLAHAPNQSGTQPLLSVLKKLKYAELTNFGGDARLDMLSSHPLLDSRISMVGAAQVTTFDSTFTWTGFNLDGDPVLTVQLDFEVRASYTRFESRAVPTGRSITPALEGNPHRSVGVEDDEEYVVFTTVTLLPDATAPVDLSDLVITRKGKNASLGLRGRRAIAPGETMSIVYSARGRTPAEGDEIENLRMQWMGAVTSWRRGNDSASR